MDNQQQIPFIFLIIIRSSTFRKS